MHFQMFKQISCKWINQAAFNNVSDSTAAILQISQCLFQQKSIGFIGIGQVEFVLGFEIDRNLL